MNTGERFSNQRRMGFVALVAASLITMSASAAFAGGATGGVDCGTHPVPGCTTTVGTGGGQGGNSGGKGGSSGNGTCHNPEGVQIPCQRDGGWAGADGCYYKPIDNLPPETIEALGGRPAGEGGWYLKTCYSSLPGGATQGFGGPVWIAGAPPVLSPDVLARMARSRLTLPKVVIEVNPAGEQLVNLPTWLSVAASSWAPQSATAAVPGYSITATARPVRAVWSLGDGSSVTCHGPGTVWRPGTDPLASSPDCGHTYTASSAGAGGGAFTVSVTVTWTVTWAGAGLAGTVPGLQTVGAIPVRVGESQTVITG